MNTQVTIKNFRNFDSEGATFDLAPITILTGCNSAGKSSLAKSILMLQNVLSQVPKVSDLGDLKMDFTTTKYNLGRFDKVLNNKAKEGDAITISYRKYSLLLSEYATVTLSFKANKVGFNDGVLDRLTITAENGEPIFAYMTSDDGKSIYEADYSLKKHFIRYCIGELYNKGFGPMPQDITEMKSVDSIIADQISLFPKIDRCGINLNISKIHQLDIPVSVPGLSCKFNLHEDIEYPATIEHLIEYGVIHYFKILSELKGKTIDELKVIFRNNLKFEDAARIEWCQKYIDIMLKDYSESGYTDFVEWYKVLESNDKARRVNQYGYDFRYESMFEDFACCGIHTTRMPSLHCHLDKTPTPEECYRQNTFNSLYYFFAYLCVCDDNRYDVDNVEKWMFQYRVGVAAEMLRIEELDVLKYMSPCRVNVQRLYTFDKDTNYFTDLILRYHSDRERKESDSKYRRRKWFMDRQQDFKYQVNTFLNKWLSNFGIGKSLEFEQQSEGLGVMLYLNKENGERQLLADEGYGITQLVSIMLQIEVAILESQQYGTANNISPEKIDKFYEGPGYHYPNYLSNKFGQENYQRLKEIFSQMNYIHSDAKKSNEIFRPQTLVIEEPEIHLHPKYQSMLADMFLDAYKTYNIRFIIETHSEYLIRESQVLVSQMGYKSNKDSDENSPFRTYYIPKDGKPYSLGYRKDGRFAEKFGDGFYNESTILTNKML